MRTHRKKGSTSIDNLSRVTQEWVTILTISDSLVDSPVLKMKGGRLLQNFRSQLVIALVYAEGVVAIMGT